jgi:predicted  nucleic acid-binding Zn-ribbon protein
MADTAKLIEQARGLTQTSELRTLTFELANALEATEAERDEALARLAAINTEIVQGAIAPLEVEIRRLRDRLERLVVDVMEHSATGTPLQVTSEYARAAVLTEPGAAETSRGLTRP